LAPFLSQGLMGKSKGKLESLKGTNGGERGDEYLLIFVGLNHWGRRESRYGGQGKV